VELAEFSSILTLLKAPPLYIGLINCCQAGLGLITAAFYTCGLIAASRIWTAPLTEPAALQRISADSAHGQGGVENNAAGELMVRDQVE